MGSLARLRVPTLPRLRAPAVPRVAWAALPIVAGLAAAGWYLAIFPGFTVPLAVTDSVSNAPLPAARVHLADPRAQVTTTAIGAFTLSSLKVPTTLSVDASGYASATRELSSPFEQVSMALDPIGVDLDAFDGTTGQTIAVSLNGAPPTVRPHVAPVSTGQTFTLSAAGFAPAEASYGGESVMRVPLVPRLDGHVTSAESAAPIVGARISVDDQVVTSDAQGVFHLARRATGTRLTVLAPGYRKGTLDLTDQSGLDVALDPNPVRATYLTYFAVGGADYRQSLYTMLDTTSVNGVVVDIKGDYGLLSYKSGVPLADSIGANDSPTIDDLDALLAELHRHNAYVIGRIVVFKDDVLARNGPRAGLNVGVRDHRTGGQWVDGEALAWVDPFQPAAWDYNVALAREAISRGFDEVQFDYIRFPTDPSPNSSVDDVVYSQPSTEANRVNALHTFLGRAHQAVNEAGGFLGIDTFGYTTWWDDDGGIGQDLSVLADDIDYYSPMVYPSTFNAGVPGFIAYPAVVSRPYDTVYLSLKHVNEKLAGRRLVLRPWLQYFDDYPWVSKVRYDAPQIEAQQRAAEDAHAVGWMLWQPGSLFTRGGLGRKT